MKLTVSVGEQSWEYDMAHLMVEEAEAVEDALDLSISDWNNQLMQGRAKAYRGLVFLLRRRSEPNLKYADVNFDLGDMSVEVQRVDPTDPDGTGSAPAEPAGSSSSPVTTASDLGSTAA